jgi:hypothetical protein
MNNAESDEDGSALIIRTCSEESQWDEEEEEEDDLDRKGDDDGAWLLTIPPPDDKTKTIMKKNAGESNEKYDSQAHPTVPSTPSSPASSTSSRPFTRWREQRKQEQEQTEQAQRMQKELLIQQCLKDTWERREIQPLEQETAPSAKQEKQKQTFQQPPAATPSTDNVPKTVLVSVSAEEGSQSQEIAISAPVSSTTPLEAVAKQFHQPFFGESLFERLQSRAQPEAVLPLPNMQQYEQGFDPKKNDKAPNSASLAITKTHHTQQHHRMDSDDCSLVSRSTLAQKRVHVLQLLLLGWLGLLLGWLPTFLSGSMCHFATVVSMNMETNYGLWKFSPVTASAMADSYCVGYSNDDDSDDTPIAARALNLMALLSGTVSLFIVWCYLIFGCYIKRIWRAGVCTSLLAGVLQAGTMAAFFWSPSSACSSYYTSCKLGPGASMALVTIAVWFVVGWEMHYNTPDATTNTFERSILLGDGDKKEEDGLIREDSHNGGFHGSFGFASLELADFRQASQQYLERFNAPATMGGYCPPDLTQSIT